MILRHYYYAIIDIFMPLLLLPLRHYLLRQIAIDIILIFTPF
jgi:hypothetical protein